jgi:hypothetical protein
VIYEINGRRIEVERPLTDDEIETIAADMQGLYGGMNPDVPTTENLTAPDAPFPEEPQTMSFGETAVESLPAITGGAAGMAGFAAGGPTLAVPMAGAGGVVGQMAQDIIKGEAFDPYEIISQGLMQASFEAGGTLVVNAAGKIIRYTPEMLRRMGLSTNAPAEEVAAQALRMAPEAGTAESRLSTQQLLQEGVPSPREGEQITGTLSRSQTGTASAFTRVLESLGEIGIFGQATFRQNDENIETILQTRMDEVLQGLAPTVRTTSEIGEAYVDTVNQANRALTDGYGQALAGIQQDFRRGMIDTRALKAKISGIIKQSRRASESGKFSTLEPETLTELERVLDLPDSIAGDALLETLKVISQKSAGMLERGAQGYNSVASGQLTDFVVNDIKPFINEQLRKINPESFVKYEAINSNYSTSKNLLSPALLKSAASRGKKEDFSGVGALLTETNNPEIVKKAYAALGEAKRVNKDLNVADAMDALRQGYLLRLVGGSTRDPKQLVNAARSLKRNPKQLEVFKEVLGVSAPGVQRLLNAAFDVADKPQVGVLGLMLRGQESKGIQLLASGAIGSGGSATDVALAAGVLAAPKLFAKFALNPTAVDKLLKLDKASRNMAPKLIMSNLTRIANEAGIDLQKEMEDELRRTFESQEMASQVQAVTQ